jgi:hypothetical protein
VSIAVVIAAVTSALAFVFTLALLDQWRERRRTFQLVWAIGSLFYAIAAGCEAIAAALGWNEPLYRVWYLTGAVWTAGWLGLGTAFLLARTRFGYAFATILLLAGVITILTWRRSPDVYIDAGLSPILYFVGALIGALAIGVDTYFQGTRWPRLAGILIIHVTVLSAVIGLTTSLAAPGYRIDPVTHVPLPDLFPASLRLLTPFMNFTGGLSLVVGALFSTYVFMPKRRILAYSLDPTQPGDQFLFNLFIAPVAITVNLVASIPGAARALVSGRIHSRVPATLLIAIGAFVPTYTDSLSRFGAPEWRALGHLLGVAFLFAGFLVSTEVFREIRVPFSRVRLLGARSDRDPDEGAAAERSA